MAVAQSILVIIHQVLLHRTPFQDLGGNFFDQRDRDLIQKRLVRRLEHLGYHFEVSPVAAVS